MNFRNLRFVIVDKIQVIVNLNATFCFRWCKKVGVKVIRLRQNPFNWQQIAVLAKQPSTLQHSCVDQKNKQKYIVSICKDTSYTKPLVAWTASPLVNIQSNSGASCELIARDEKVRIFCYTQTRNKELQIF